MVLIYAGRIIKFPMSPYKFCASVINARKKEKKKREKNCVALNAQFLKLNLSGNIVS